MSRLWEYVHDDGGKLIVEATERIDNDDKKKIKDFLLRPRSGSFVLSSYANGYSDNDRTILFRKIGRKFLVTFNNDFYEITNYIIDTNDDYGLSFTSDSERATNTQHFNITVE
jgi:hypothetical protein